MYDLGSEAGTFGRRAAFEKMRIPCCVVIPVIPAVKTMSQRPYHHRRRWAILALAACLLSFGLMLLFYVNTPRTSKVIPAATATQVAPTAMLATDTPRVVPATPSLFAFDSLGDVSAINISYDVGSMLGRSLRELRLTKNGPQFEGQFTTQFDPHLSGTFTPKAPKAIVLPPDLAHQFLTVFAEVIVAAPRSYPHELAPTVSDCDERIVVRLQTTAGIAVFSTVGCGVIGMDSFWVITNLAGETFTTYTDTLRNALDLLEPFLKP